MSILIKGLSKKYQDGTQALKDIELNIEKGLFGLMGPNGAGKTTLMRILVTIMPFDKGHISINGLDIKKDSYEIKKRIGYLPQEFGLYSNLTLIEFLDYMCLLHEVSGKEERKRRIDNAIEVTNLKTVANKKLKTFSGGMKRRAGIAQCLLNEPEVIIVDEPTVGLDPEERLKFKNLLRLLGEEKTVIISTHIISDLENLCTQIGIMKKGEVLFQGNIKDLSNKVKAKPWVGRCKLDEISGIEENYIIVTKKLVEDTWQYRVLGEEPPSTNDECDSLSLEDGYIALMRGDD